MRRVVLLLMFSVLAVAAPGCNVLNDLGNAWVNAECPAGMGGGGGGDGGAGGDDGEGGAPDEGAGGAPGASVSAGAGPGDVSSAAVGTGAGPGDGAGAGAAPGMMRTAGGHPRRVRRHHKEPIGTAVSADCPEPAVAVPALPPPPPSPKWVGLDTGTLRDICVNNDVNGSASQSGITLNRTCGVAFETWCIKTMGSLPRWDMLIPSPQRKSQNTTNGKGGLPGSVIPEQVLDQDTFSFSLGTLSVKWVTFPLSVFVEVKAVNGTLTLGTSNYQILGLVDAVNTWPKMPAGNHAPPAVFFITTSNTTISPKPLQVVDQATLWKVAIWQQIVEYNTNSANKKNPDLRLGDATCLNDALYAGVLYTIWPSSGGVNPLTWATDQEQDLVGAVPDPDSPAMVP